MAVFSVIPAAYAVTARPSVTANAAARRLPTLTAYINAKATNVTTSTGSSSTTVTLDDTECLSAYTECMKADDACGSEFQECTNRTLFMGQMPECLHVLTQCSPSGINDLFGTSNIGNLGDVATTDPKTGEVLEYKYPLDGSAMGQWIKSAEINNKFDTTTCVKRYTSCLNKDSVCGADFELCTTSREFKKQALLCDSTLARCQSEGVIELLGAYPWKPSSSTIGGRVAKMIEDGAALASYNAVSTCYKVVDQCFLGACAANPLRCIEGVTLEQLTTANMLSDEPQPVSDNGTGVQAKSDVNRYLKTSCMDTIGANKYCYMTFFEKTPSQAELSDVDMQEEVFGEAINQRKKFVDSKIQDIMQKFDTKAKDKCKETIRTCAMRSCGDGVGSVCYTAVFNGTDESINKASTRNEIKRSCEAVVSTDLNCQYAYVSAKNEAYSYTYANNNVFDALFPEYAADSANDPIGVVASLNASLASNYSMAAIADMKKQCQALATNCVKSMCGTDYVNCYRNRTDILSDLTSTGDAAFDKSMNKVGGVLDYTIVLGLCMNTVKNADVCDEHLKITAARLKKENKDTGWGDATTVRDGWKDAGSAKSLEVAEGVQAVDENNNKLCTTAKGVQCVCNEFVGEDICDKPVYVSIDLYQSTQAANTLFKELITDLEYEAQAKYNAKLTKQQNMCLSSNAGGVMGNNDLGSTFVWAKLKSSKVPTNYATMGLGSKDFVASNDLYGSFCRVRVNIASDDKNLQDMLSKSPEWATAYFAAGDSFTCGSWISSEVLEEIANAVAADARKAKELEQDRTGFNNWYWALPAVMAATGVGGAYLGKGIQDGSVFGGLSGNGNGNKKLTQTKREQLVKTCQRYVGEAKTAEGYTNIYAKYNYALEAASDLDVDTATFTDVSSKLSAYRKAGDKDSCPSSGTDNCKTAKQDLDEALDKLSTACLEKKSVEKSGGDEAKKAAGIGGAVTALVGGALTVGVIETARKTQLGKAEQEAYDKFMEEIGSHIFCTIGGEEAGSYGDVVSTSME